jgi:hypothetical protein
MNGLYDILLFLFIVGAVSQGFNEMGVFSHSLPSGPSMSDGKTTVTQFQDSATSTPDLFAIAVAGLRVLGMGVVAMFTVIPMVAGYCSMLGVPAALTLILCGIIQAPLSYVTFTGLFEWWTGRNLT